MLLKALHFALHTTSHVVSDEPLKAESHLYVKDGVKVKVTLRLTVSQSVSLGVEPHLGLMTRYLLLFDRYGPAPVGRLT
jgi:hypothetical protein